VQIHIKKLVVIAGNSNNLSENGNPLDLPMKHINIANLRFCFDMSTIHSESQQYKKLDFHWALQVLRKKRFITTAFYRHFD
jgi:hypothetical protein